MKRFFVLLVVLATLVSISTSAASGKTLTNSCWQLKFTFINYPTQFTSLAAWRITQFGKVKAHGSFSFKGDFGGGYQRLIKVCVTTINPFKTVHAGVSTKISTECGNCDTAIAIRRTK